jgi:hypothetical protein
MSKHKLHTNVWLLRVSVVACVLSIMVFVLLLVQTNKNQNQALAASYGADQIVFAVNQERIKKGIPPLTVNPKLTQAAQAKASDMASKSYFSHISPNGKKWSDFIKDSKYNYAEAGENLANGFDTVSDMVDAWMKSPTHRENILNPGVLETGVGLEFGKLDNYPTIFVAQDFGREMPAPKAKAEPKVEKTETTDQPKNTSEPAKQTTPAQPEPAKVEPKPATLGELIDLPEIKLGE